MYFTKKRLPCCERVPIESPHQMLRIRGKALHLALHLPKLRATMKHALGDSAAGS